MCKRSGRGRKKSSQTAGEGGKARIDWTAFGVRRVTTFGENGQTVQEGSKKLIRRTRTVYYFKRRIVRRSPLHCRDQTLCR